MHLRLRNAREIASAVEYLHQRLITHGDLKNLNIMLTSDLIAKVCATIQRLNSAVMLPSIQRLNSAVSMKSSHGAHGTIQWSAPEVLHKASANPFTDMYALGVIR